jgi:hypothetical protein
MAEEYYCGFFRGRPHVSCVGFDHGDATLVYLFRKKKDAIADGFTDVRKVKIVEVKK